MNQKILCVQDLSCFGKCSLTITLPILACAGMEAIPLPTALLSTHTGGLGNVYMHDLCTDMEAIRSHWATLSLSMDALYCGYVSDHSQLKQIHALIRQYPDAYRLIDPVMGDHGKLYRSLPKDLPQAMLALCQSADCITPNMTEAYALLEEGFQEGPYTRTQIETLLYKLHQRTHANIVLKGIYDKNNELGCAILDQGEIMFLMGKRLPYQYHGTGDLFASALLGAYLQGNALAASVRIAMEFTYTCMEYSDQCGQDERYGLQFEPCLSSYINLLHQSQANSIM